MNSKIYNVVILDKSGSMTSIRKQAVDSVNETFGCIRSMRKKNVEQEQFVTLVAFCGCEQKVIYENTPIEKVNNITPSDYEPCCMTPLYYAIGNVCTRLHTTVKDDESASVAVTIITDGYENASRRYDYERVRRMIERQKEKYGWEFLFLGANIDAAKEAARFGIGADRAVNYKCDEAGTALNYKVIGEAVCSVRAARPLSADWKRRIDEDVQKRGR